MRDGMVLTTLPAVFLNHQPLAAAGEVSTTLLVKQLAVEIDGDVLALGPHIPGYRWLLGMAHPAPVDV
ncbi:hypothetical protein CALVIDRAFT_567470 [Calocera viscosa TUFC12733]|uniref:Uncharacterized protein n=1 Tax=Calocera viscosa (strain TUFC12733) TaxID=1330018 RepID=A0A167I9H6_CALVF|nr:hypothetical protein CALVIDRAFT_567470 [Calocera viscosa TUFC12733]